jgi:CheY-like chemotaxis protein
MVTDGASHRAGGLAVLKPIEFNRRSMSVPRPPRSSPFTLLLVDPHGDTRDVYAQSFQLQGCEVDVAEDGREGLAKALTYRYDAIVMETRLPGINGYELCRLLRRDPATMSAIILVVTADPRTTEAEARAAGADAVLEKPCLPETVLTALKRVAGESRAHERTRQPIEMRAADTASPAPRRFIMSRAHRRGNTTTPPLQPPTLHCPECDSVLAYDYSYLGGVSARHAEQWDYLACPQGCGAFEYRQRTRRVRLIVSE